MTRGQESQKSYHKSMMQLWFVTYINISYFVAIKERWLDINNSLTYEAKQTLDSS